MLAAIIADAQRLDLPQWTFRAIVVAGHRAWAENGAAQVEDLVTALTLDCGKAATIVQHQQHIVDGAVAQAIGQLDAVAPRLISFRVNRNDVAVGDNDTGFLIVRDSIGGKLPGITVQSDIARRRDDLTFVVIVHLIGSKANGVTGCERTTTIAGWG